jgi:hypothetical protein
MPANHRVGVSEVCNLVVAHSTNLPFTVQVYSTVVVFFQSTAQTTWLRTAQSLTVQ